MYIYFMYFMVYGPIPILQFQRIRRKKCALLLSYNGQGHLGMQL
jgi:hypothetical protein